MGCGLDLPPRAEKHRHFGQTACFSSARRATVGVAWRAVCSARLLYTLSIETILVRLLPLAQKVEYRLRHHPIT